MGVEPKNSGTPKWMVYNGNPIKMDDLGGFPHYFWVYTQMVQSLPNDLHWDKPCHTHVYHQQMSQEFPYLLHLPLHQSPLWFYMVSLLTRTAIPALVAANQLLYPPWN